MSPQRKREIGAWITILVGAATLLGGATASARSSFVTTSRYDRDRTADSAWKADSRAMQLDILCSPHVDPANWRCRPRGER